MEVLQALVNAAVSRLDLVGVGVVVFSLGLCPVRSPGIASDVRDRRAFSLRVAASALLFLIGLALSIAGARAWPIEAG